MIRRNDEIHFICRNFLLAEDKVLFFLKFAHHHSANSFSLGHITCLTSKAEVHSTNISLTRYKLSIVQFTKWRVNYCRIWQRKVLVGLSDPWSSDQDRPCLHVAALAPVMANCVFIKKNKKIQLTKNSLALIWYKCCYLNYITERIDLLICSMLNVLFVS